MAEREISSYRQIFKETQFILALDSGSHEAHVYIFCLWFSDYFEASQ